MFFQTDNDILFCDAYIPHKNATQNILSKAGYFGDFENAILKCQGKTKHTNFRGFKYQNWVTRKIKK